MKDEEWGYEGGGWGWGDKAAGWGIRLQDDDGGLMMEEWGDEGWINDEGMRGMKDGGMRRWGWSMREMRERGDEDGGRVYRHEERKSEGCGMGILTEWKPK